MTTLADVTHRTHTPTRRKVLSYLARSWPLYAMLIPGLVLLLIFAYYPMYGVRIAFQDYNPGLGFERSPWVGLKNFRFLMLLPQFKDLLRNTLVLAVSKIVVLQFTAIILALLLNEIRLKIFKRIVNQILYLPYFLSWVVLAGILLDMLAANGLIGRFLNSLNIPSFIFLGNAKFFPYTVVISHTWKDVGFSTIIYLAALTGIDPTLYEAAAVDGADRLQRLRHITLPGIAPMIVLIACLSLGGILDAGFDQVLNLYNPAVYATGDILDTYVYRAGLISARYSLAAAVGLFKSGVGFILIMVAYWMAAKFASYRVF